MGSHKYAVTAGRARERGRREWMRRDMEEWDTEHVRGEERMNSGEDVDVFAVILKKNTIIPSSRSAGEAG